jgi:adenylate cyclase class 2
MSVHTETEAKFKLDQPQSWQARLREAGAVPLGRVLEINRLFDTPDARLRNADCGLRLREWRTLGAGAAGAPGTPGRAAGTPGAVLTFKGPRAATGLKSRAEIETALADAAAAGQILNRLGVREVLVFEKIRETWRLGPCEVALDELPRLGWYLEIEGRDPEAVTTVRAQLGLADTPIVGETYPALAAAAGDREADGRVCLRFTRAGGGSEARS